MLPSDSNRITGPEQRKIMTTTASDIGIFSGKEKKRLELSNDELDPTHKFAIALFEEAVNTTDPNHKKDKKGVYVHLRKNDQGVLMTDVADISSIAKRLGLSEDEVRESANKKIGDHTKLDETIQKIVNDYEKEMKVVKDLIGELKIGARTDDVMGMPLDNCREIIKKFLGDDDKKLKNSENEFGEGMKLLKGFLEDDLKKLKDFNNVVEFRNKLDKFEAKLAKLDQNFAPNAEIPREKVTEGSELLKSIPKLSINKTPPKVKKYPDYNPDGGAVRLNIAKHEDDNNQYAIKTDGYIYHTQPEKKGKFLPYSIDDKTWVLLNVNSLFARTGLTLKDLEGQSFDNVINKSNEKQQLDFLVRGFQERVTFNSEGVEKSIICSEIFKSTASYTDFNSFLDRFKNLSDKELVEELSGGLMKVMKAKGYGKLAAQLMEELGNKAVNSAVELKNWGAFNKLIAMFVDLNLDLNKIDDEGNTLLHLAIINGQETAIQTIAGRNKSVRWGEADSPVKIDIQNKEGKTAKELIIDKYGEEYFRKLNF